MRWLGLMAALSMVASCGSKETDSKPDSVAGQGNQAVNEPDATEEANLTAAAEVPDAVETAKSAASGSVSPCLMQGTDRIGVRPFRAIGTEPFWSARVEGRCVTYSTPEDQQGIRVWTRYTPGSNQGGAWLGQLGGKKFELRTRPQPACSDGMSDKSYPVAVELTVNGEQRRGCAEPL